MDESINDTWIPHEPSTWPWRLANLKRDVMGSVFQGYWDKGCPVMKEHPMSKGTAVKIVMVSRFRDVGITDDLSKEYGYCAIVQLDDLEPTEVPS